MYKKYGACGAVALSEDLGRSIARTRAILKEMTKGHTLSLDSFGINVDDALYFGLSMRRLLLMADMEIYVDGLVNFQIQSLNAVVDTIREKLSKRTGSEADDAIINMIRTSHIEDDEYFFNLLHHDMDEKF